MAGNNHYSNCNCGFCTPKRKTVIAEEELESLIIRKKKESLCIKCGRAVEFRRNKRGGGWAIFEKSHHGKMHVCWERDDETPDLFAPKK